MASLNHFLVSFIFSIFLNNTFAFSKVPKSSGRTNPHKSLDVGEPLFLTPYLENGLVIEAKIFSRVRNISPVLESYSGFITVNSTHDSNMFFWFFPAQKSPSTAPVILWCEGGPGVSGMYSLFNENGPYKVDKDHNLSLREHSWNLDNNMIYMDNPMGAGFSFAKSEAGYLTSGTDPAHLYNFLTQFFTMFPDYQKNDFYASGVSFGGIFAPTIAHEIHRQNQLPENKLKINLKGLLVESPWSDPVRQVDYGEFLYQMGFLDQSDLEHVKDQTQLIATNINSEKWTEAKQIWGSILVLPNSYFLNRTKLGVENLYNFIGHGAQEDTSEYFFSFIEQDFVRHAIHVGNKAFVPINPASMDFYEDKGFKTVKPYIETLLNAPEGYKVLFYAGQLDIITFHLGIDNMIDGLEWFGAKEFREARSRPWKANNGLEVSGYVTNAFNLTYVMMRNAGHDANTDQPPWGLDIVNRFTKNIPF